VSREFLSRLAEGKPLHTIRLSVAADDFHYTYDSDTVAAD
jgi:hypothetical protein